MNRWGIIRLNSILQICSIRSSTGLSLVHFHITNLKWNIREFGPLPVPQKGHVVEMDRTTYHLYKQLIGWEQRRNCVWKTDRCYWETVWFLDIVLKRIIILYLVIIWLIRRIQGIGGCCRKKYIVGKATRIWYSEDKFTEKPRWDRMMKKIK